MLVAEDNPINQAILRDQLEQLGCRAVVASDGNEALGYWQQGAFALVLTDLNMPGMDGYGLARALRARGARVPIHGATANADPAERERCQESGMQGVLVKPITLEALQRLLTRISQGDAGVQALPESPASADAREDDDAPLQVPDRMQALFVQTMQGDLDSLRQAIAAADPSRVVQVLHRIRGALVIVGAPALVDRGLQIEHALAGGADLATQAAPLAGFQRRLEQLLHPCLTPHPLPFPTTRPCHDHTDPHRRRPPDRACRHPRRAGRGTDLEVVGEAADPVTLIELMTRTRPQAVITDYSMPGVIASGTASS